MVFPGHEDIPQTEDLARVRRPDHRLLEGEAGHFLAEPGLPGETEPVDHPVAQTDGVGPLALKGAGDAADELLGAALHRGKTGLDSPSDTGIHPLQTHFKRRQAALHGLPHPRFQRIDFRILRGIGVEEEVGEGGRGLDVTAGHHVGDVEVAVMADGGHHGNRTGGDGDGKIIVVETRKVELAAAPAQDQQGVIAAPLRHFDDGGNDGRRGRFALHQGLEEIHLEGIPRLVLEQVPAEIAIAGGRLRGDHRQAVRQPRQGQFLLHVHVAPGRQLLDGFFALEGRFAEGEGRIDVIDEKADAVKLAVAHLHAHEDGNPGTEFLAGRLLEKGLELRVMPLPDHRPGLRHGLAAAALRQAQVAVPVRARTPLADLGLDPHLLREGILDACLDEPLELQQIHIVFRHIVHLPIMYKYNKFFLSLHCFNRTPR